MPVAPTDAIMQRSPHLFMRLLFHIQSFNHRNPHVKGVRNFSLLPHTDGFTAKYITIDTSGLRAMLRRVDPATPLEGVLLANKDEVWGRLFAVRKATTRNRLFGHMIITDGKAVSVLVRKPKAGPKEEVGELSAANYDIVWGLDPGMRDMSVATCDQDRRQAIRCSSAQYYEDAKYRLSNRKRERWKARNPHIHAIENGLPSAKTVDTVALEWHMRYGTQHRATLRVFYGQQRFKNLKFLRYCASKRKMHKLYLRLASAGQRTLVGFGDWGLKSAEGVVKGCAAGPSGRLKRELRRYCKVVDVDEYRTSRTCNSCKLRELRNLRAPQWSKELSRVTGIRWSIACYIVRTMGVQARL